MAAAGAWNQNGRNEYFVYQGWYEGPQYVMAIAVVEPDPDLAVLEFSDGLLGAWILNPWTDFSVSRPPTSG
jgi:hypothetical protein